MRLKKIIMAGVLALALSGCTVSVSAPHIPFLHSQAYRDGYAKVHNIKWTDADRAQTRQAIASGYWTRESMCNIMLHGPFVPATTDHDRDWIAGCAAAMHDDLGT
jgi:hypothetical protein